MVAFPPILKRVLDRQPAPLVWPPLKIGHRGAAGEAPENTIVSFELALRQGADGVEFDVHLSSDGVPVVIHDARLTRTTSGSGWVHEHRARVLRRLDAGSWFNRRHPFRARERYAGARIPLLAEVLHWVRARQCLAFVEIKGRQPDLAAKILKEIDRARVQDLARVISFDPHTLERVRELNGNVRLGMDTSSRLLAIRRARALGVEALLPHWAIASRRFIRRAHRESLLVAPWTVNNRPLMWAKILDGADGIITNYPARLTAVVDRLARARQEA